MVRCSHTQLIVTNLSGIIIECILRRILSIQKIKYEENIGIGKLIKLIREHRILNTTNLSIVANMINENRIYAVHGKGFTDKDSCNFVINGLISLIKECASLMHPKSQDSE